MRRVSNVLLCVGLLALLALPATALSQGGVESGWTDSPPNLNGKLGAQEWSAATRLALKTVTIAAPLPGLEGLLDSEGLFAEDVSPQQATGWLYLMNDATYLYLAATLDVGAPAGDPDYAVSVLLFVFEDEPQIGDGRWAANLCSRNPDEGQMRSGSINMASSGLDPLEVAAADVDVDYFEPIAEEGLCTSEFDPPGYRRGLGYDPMTFETRLNLNISPLDVAPGQCFYAGVGVGDLEYYFSEEFGRTLAFWPDDLVTEEPELPGALVQVCLAAPEEEEFVPEPGTIALLGTGLAGLVGYATLRWRSRRKE